MKLKLHIVFIFILQIVLPVFVTGQGIILSSGIYMTLSQGTMVLQSNWVNNGNYSDQNGTIIINGVTNVSGSSSNTFGNVIVAMGATLNINPQNSVTVIGTLTNNAGIPGFVLKSDATGTASLIHNSNNVPATVQRYISGTAEAWHFLSAPVSAQSISGSWIPSGTYSNNTGYDLYIWNEPTNCWIYKLDITSPVNWNTVHSGANFVPGRGYLYSVQATNPTNGFAGNLNNGSQSFGLTFSSSDVNLKGFNLVGNPYPSSIDWQATSGWTRSSLVSSGGGYDMWIWNPAANNYGVFNSATGIGTNSVTRYISPMQGYFVQAADAGNLILDNPVRVHDGANAWKKAIIYPDKLSLVVESLQDNTFDESLLLFGYPDNQSGTAKLFSPYDYAPSLYLHSADRNYSVRYLKDTIENRMVPVMFKPGRDGKYTLTCNFDNNKFKMVLLEDRKIHKLPGYESRTNLSF